MIRFNARFSPSTVSLPISVTVARSVSNTVVGVRLLVWLFQWVYINIPKATEEQKALIQPRKDRRAEFKATKAYADERQKAPRNRRRKPSKAIANVYNLDQ